MRTCTLRVLHQFLHLALSALYVAAASASAAFKSRATLQPRKWCRAPYNDGQRLRTRDRHVQAVAAEKKLNPTRRCVAARSAHGEDDNGCFLSLELVHGTDTDIAEPPSKTAYL